VRILVIITSPEYVRNYISTMAFSELDLHDISYCFSSKIAIDQVNGKQEGADLVELEGNVTGKLRRFAFRLNTQLKMYQLRFVNPNFLFRLRRELIPIIYSLLVVPNFFLSRISNEFYKKFPFSFISGRLASLITSSLLVLKGLFSDVPGLLRYGLISILSRTGLDSKLTSLLWRRVPLDLGILSKLNKYRPDLIIIPSMAVDFESYEWTRASAQGKIGKILLLIDNWDNLSSKSAFVRAPDFMGVMGSQSYSFGIAFHRMSPDSISIIGTPRFEVYRKYLTNKSSILSSQTPCPAERPYILFAGCAAPFDEIRALERLSIALARLEDQLPSGTVIIYRPHPWGRRKHYLEMLSYKRLFNVIIDPQIEEGNKLDGYEFQPALEYYPRLLSEALLVVCPLSTMLLEASIMRNRVVALIHEDRISLLSPNRIFANYRHFEGVEGLENITLLADLDKLETVINKAYLDGKLRDCPVGLDCFVEISDRSYAERLELFVNRLEAVVSP
jgi:hypothetical protein